MRTSGKLSLVTVSVAALLLSACGSESLGGEPAGEQAPSVEVTQDEDLSAKLPESIKSAGVIKIGTDPTYAPNEFLAADGKTVQGMDVDLFNAVAAKFGVKTEWQPSDFGAIINGVNGKKYDIGISSFTINDERKKQVTMVSYFSAGTQWATKAGNPAELSPEDACGKRVAVGTGSTQLTDDLPKRQAACEAAGKPAIVVNAYQAQNEATAAVVSGKEDAMLADSPITAYAVKQTGGKLELAGDIYDSAPYGFVVQKDRDQLGQAIAGAVAAMQADGSYARILAEWGIEGGALDAAPAVNPQG